MKIKSKMSNKTKKLLTVENLIGLVLAVLILFDVKMNMAMTQFVNSPLGIVICIIVTIVLFVFLHSILGFLFLIYLYENVKHLNKMFANLTRQSQTKKATNAMKEMNKNSYNVHVEEEVITNMAPIIKKRENPNAKFMPNDESSMKYNLL